MYGTGEETGASVGGRTLAQLQESAEPTIAAVGDKNRPRWCRAIRHHLRTMLRFENARPKGIAQWPLPLGVVRIAKHADLHRSVQKIGTATY